MIAWQIRRIVVLALCILTFAVVYALAQDTVYNPMTRQWETVGRGSNPVLKYNPHDGSWSQQSVSSQPVYNGHENTWQWSSGHEGSRIQPIQPLQKIR